MSTEEKPDPISEGIASSLNGISGISVSKDGMSRVGHAIPYVPLIFENQLELQQATPRKITNLIKVGDRLIEVQSGNYKEQLEELKEMGILRPPKPPTPKSKVPVETLAPGFKQRRHAILARKKKLKKKTKK